MRPRIATRPPQDEDATECNAERFADFRAAHDSYSTDLKLADKVVGLTVRTFPASTLTTRVLKLTSLLPLPRSRGSTACLPQHLPRRVNVTTGMCRIQGEGLLYLVGRVSGTAGNLYNSACSSVSFRGSSRRAKAHKSERGYSSLFQTTTQSTTRVPASQLADCPVCEKLHPRQATTALLRKKRGKEMGSRGVP